MLLQHASGLTLTVDEQAGTATLSDRTLDLEQARWAQVCALPAAIAALTAARERAEADAAGQRGSLRSPGDLQGNA